MEPADSTISERGIRDNMLTTNMFEPLLSTRDQGIESAQTAHILQSADRDDDRPFARTPSPLAEASSDGFAPLPNAGTPTPPLYTQNVVHNDDSGTDQADSDYGEQSVNGNNMPRRRWRSIKEDVSVPCEDELKHIASLEEHSALEYSHWEKETYFDLQDPELLPGDQGRVDWIVKNFNGTKENPNTETIMRSQTVEIGGLDWRIKFYPRGNGTDFLSAYVECVTMLSDDYVETEDFIDPPFPFLHGADRIRKRQSVAAQISLIMYNPAEPRVHEFQTEAHQFHKQCSDYGWKYFSRVRREDFHIRRHKQRQALLRNDTLAFSAYIRIINDTSGCLWEHHNEHHVVDPGQLPNVTGLRPFPRSMQPAAAVLILLHFKPFRDFIRQTDEECVTGRWLQHLLVKMYTRQRTTSSSSRGPTFDCDVMEMLWRFSVAFAKDCAKDKNTLYRLNSLIGDFSSAEGTVFGSNRLNTKKYSSIQEAVDQHTRKIACPAMLTMELQRQEHDKYKRKWKKLTNAVDVQDHVLVSGHHYVLFAFITHRGHLHSNCYSSFVRPRGIGNGWYAYENGRVTRLTEKQARDRNFTGTNEDRPLCDAEQDTFELAHGLYRDELQSEVCCVAMYVRQDYAGQAFAPCLEEKWIPAFVGPEASEISKQASEAATSAESGLLESGMLESQAELFTQTESIDIQYELVDLAAGVTTPDPEILMDGEDVVMGGGEGASEDFPESGKVNLVREHPLKESTIDWLGRPYYQGHFKDRRYHGRGHLIEVNGDEYIGSFKDGQQNGYGKMIYSHNGDIYEGLWVDGRHHGQGKLTEHSTGNVFEGGWKDGRKHGGFVLKGTVTDEDRNCCTICYDQEISTAFYDCGHVVACKDCAANIDVCPVCRRRVDRRLQLFGVKISLA